MIILDFTLFYADDITLLPISNVKFDPLNNIRPFILWQMIKLLIDAPITAFISNFLQIVQLS